MIILVTKNDILNGIPRNSNKCPLSIALKRSFKTDNVFVQFGRVKIDDKEFKIPNEVGRFIYHFDNGRKVKPIKFNMCSKNEDHSGREKMFLSVLLVLVVGLVIIKIFSILIK